jgi:cytochrome c5
MTMPLSRILSALLVCAVIVFAGAAQAQLKSKTTPTDPPTPTVSGPATLKATPKGKQRFEACCTSCPAGGCTGCNAYPDTPNLNCGSGLIKANCQVVNDTTTCVRDDG